ncbi:MAG: M23 family metallopeptidase [Candidatus Saccharimonadales bacterium]
MNLMTAKIITTFRNEIMLVLGVILLLITLPVIAVVELANVGVSAAASSLVGVNPSNHKVEIYDPKGDLVTTLDVTTTWPVAGVVTLEFGASDPPYQDHHTGIDIADSYGKIGQPVTTFMPGTVSVVMNVDNQYGRYVFIDHGNAIQSQYWHLSEALVKVGQQVKPDDVIGLEGATGRATGPHVHFQIDVFGIPVDPRDFISGNPRLDP